MAHSEVNLMIQNITRVISTLRLELWAVGRTGAAGLASLKKKKKVISFIGQHVTHEAIECNTLPLTIDLYPKQKRKV